MNKIAVVVGHDQIEQGAFSNILKQSEYAYYSELVKLLPFDIYYRSTRGSYMDKMRELASRVNGKGYTLIVELHFNSFNGKANGTEALYYHKSTTGKRWAEIYCKNICKEYGTVNRGAKGISGGNGFGFVNSMDAPAIVLEPFFGDNAEAIKFKDLNKHAKLLIDTLC
jgi:N-acetylmuramoyl-L-alanine amidase